MKLYATVKSERASKGQGGNKQLEIIITVDNELKEEACTIKVVSDTTEEGYPLYHIDYYEKGAEEGTNILSLVNNGSGKLVLQGEEEPKDKQKCSICGDDIYGSVQVHHHNEKCKKCGYEIIATQTHDCLKGKKQKGERMYKCSKCGREYYLSKREPFCHNNATQVQI